MILSSIHAAVHGGDGVFVYGSHILHSHSSLDTSTCVRKTLSFSHIYYNIIRTTDTNRDIFDPY